MSEWRVMGRRDDQRDDSAASAGAAAFGRRDHGRRAVERADFEEGRAIPVPTGCSVRKKQMKMMHRILLIKGEVGYSSIDSISYACFRGFVHF